MPTRVSTAKKGTVWRKWHEMFALVQNHFFKVPKLILKPYFNGWNTYRLKKKNPKLKPSIIFLLVAKAKRNNDAP